MLNSSPSNSVDFKWFKEHLCSEILPNWLQATTDEGIFLPHFDRMWTPGGKGYGTLVSQSRLIYNFSRGYELTGSEDYFRAVENGTKFLLENFWDNENGGWYWSCSRNGEILDKSKDLYGHAFAIFGLSHAYATLGDEEIKEAAIETWDVINNHFADKQGGYVQGLSTDFTHEVEDIKSQNPIMHLFEALISFSNLCKPESLVEEAEKIARFVTEHLVRSSNGILPELFTLDWKELPEDRGGRIDTGHALEWSYLLSWAVESGFSYEYLTHATNFLEYGLRFGYDFENGGIFSPVSPTGNQLAIRKGWWQQCELIRSLMHFAVIRGREDLWEVLSQSLNYIKEYFVDHEYGGWFQIVEARSGTDVKEEESEWKVSPRLSHLFPRASFIATDKGSEWKVDYHIVGMCVEANRPEYGGCI